MSRVSIYRIPRHEMWCPKEECVYNKSGLCDEPRINKGNGDAECHKMNNKDLLVMLGIVKAKTEL